MIGRLAYKPIIIELKAQTRIVEVTIAEKGIPVLARIVGLTMIIYAVAKKLVMAARNSILSEV